MFTKFLQMQLILLVKIDSNNFTLCVFIICSFYIIVSRTYTFNGVHRIHFLKLKCKKKSNVKYTYCYVDKRKKRKKFV